MARATADLPVRLFHWNADESKAKIAKLEAAGYRVLFDLPGADGYRALRKEELAAYVIDLNRLPSHGREVAVYFRTNKATRHIPTVFVDGDAEKIERIKKVLPDATFTTWRGIRGALKKAIANAPANPVVPESNLAGYSGTPLPKKLGIKAGATVILAGAPDDFADTLGELPDGVLFKHQARGENDLVLWFVTSRQELEKKIERMGKLMGDGMWIIWPKQASGMKTDLTGNVVREVGLASGLVDYKVCAVDATWSGLKFARRKKK